MGSFPTAEEITRDWGERCPEYHRECSLCQMWGMHDETARLRAEVERLTQSRDGYAKQAAARAHECDRIRAEERERAAQIADRYLWMGWRGSELPAAIRASKDAGGGE